MAPSCYNYLHPCLREIQTRNLDIITFHDNFFLRTFGILDYLPILFQYFLMLLKGYLEPNWGWYSSTCRNRNEQDSKPYTPGFIIVVLALFSYWHSDLYVEDKCPASSDLFIFTFKEYCHSRYRKNPANLALLAICFHAHLGYRGSTVVKVLCYKSEGRCFDPSWCYWNFSFT